MECVFLLALVALKRVSIANLAHELVNAPLASGNLGGHIGVGATQNGESEHQKHNVFHLSLRTADDGRGMTRVPS